jgi:hypothetical protein
VQISRRRDATEKHDLVVIAKNANPGELEPSGERPLDFLGPKSIGKLPRNGGREPGVAGVDPVDVPAIPHHEPDSDPERRRGAHCPNARHELSVDWLQRGR